MSKVLFGTLTYDNDTEYTKFLQELDQPSAVAMLVAAAAYAQGKCPGIDTCASQLQACQAQAGTGNDKADCAEGSVSVCFAAADNCVDSAARECGEKPPECKGPAGLIMLIVGLAFAGFARK